MDFLDKTLLFAVVTFREDYHHCTSFKTLYDSFCASGLSAFHTLHVFVFDNTDQEAWEVRPKPIDHTHLIYTRDSKNPGISRAYNHIARFADSENYRWIVFLDQDTSLPLNAYEVYYHHALQFESGVAAPVVSVQDNVISPSQYNCFRTAKIKNLQVEKALPLNNITCINSGLMVSTSVFFKCGGYDPALRLDFCDHEFIERVSKKIPSIHILNLNLQQDFSTDTNSLQSALFRYQIFLKDMKAYRKIHQGNFLIFMRVDLPHLMRLTLTYKTLAFVKQRFF